jgi:hypothetical protein
MFKKCFITAYHLDCAVTRTSRLSNTDYGDYCHKRVKHSDNFNCHVTKQEADYLDHTNIQQARQDNGLKRRFYSRSLNIREANEVKVTQIPARTCSSPERPLYKS